MAVSTNSVIHYTDSLDKIKGILEYGFKVKYCTESLVTKGNLTVEGAYPMVSFCDIPLSSIGQHIGSYGYYGIGLSKSWAKANGLNPVLYLDRDSNIGETIYAQLTVLLKNKSEETKQFNPHFVNLISYAKNYDGSLLRGGKTVTDYNFYNEREWRFVPLKSQLGKNKSLMNASTYLANKDKFNSDIKDILLKFEPKDISYILVKTEEEITDMVKHIRRIFSDKCTATQLEVLLTRIMAIEHIINDF